VDVNISVIVNNLSVSSNVPARLETAKPYDFFVEDKPSLSDCFTTCTSTISSSKNRAVSTSPKESSILSVKELKQENSKNTQVFPTDPKYEPLEQASTIPVHSEYIKPRNGVDGAVRWLSETLTNIVPDTTKKNNAPDTMIVKKRNIQCKSRHHCIPVVVFERDHVVIFQAT